MAQLIAMQRHSNPAQFLWPIRLLHGNQDQPDGQERRNGSDPEHRLKMIGRQPHQADGEKRSKKRADRVERLAQAEACAAQMRRRNIGDERVARRAADAFADAVDEARGNQPSDRNRQCGKIGLVKAARP